MVSPGFDSPAPTRASPVALEEPVRKESNDQHSNPRPGGHPPAGLPPVVYANRAVLEGTLAAAPEFGASLARLLVTVRLDDRTDVLPVAVREPDVEVVASEVYHQPKPAAS